MQPDLIAHIEKAQPSEAWIVFGEAFRSAFPETDGFICGRKWADLYAGFVIYMNAEAYLDAAAMFVPEGWSVKLIAHPQHPTDPSDKPITYAECYLLDWHDWTADRRALKRCEAEAATPYYALLSAAMKVRQTDERD